MPISRILIATFVSACALAGLVFSGPAPVQADEILVSAAASLTEVMQEIGKAFTKANPQIRVRFNFAASGALQQQIEQGAPVDVFASASEKEIEALAAKGKLARGTRLDFAGNRLVLIAPAGRPLQTWDDLKSPAVKRIAISNPASVPSGRYAQETLTRRGLWAAAQPKLIPAENVRQTLTYVANGDVDAGVVFRTDARPAHPAVRIVQTAVPGRDHTPIRYPAAVVADAPSAAAARRFVAFLRSREAQAILKRYGFLPADAPAKPRR